MSRQASGLTPLHRALAALPAAHPGVRHAVVGFSGGPDSTALLLLAREALRGWSLSALHVDHGLHPDHRRWAGHCRSLCRQFGIPLEVAAVTVEVGREGLEAAARAARYRAFAAAMAPDRALLLAQHRDDQAETFLLRACRGAGIDGLAGMPAARRLGSGLLLRPLLGFSRAQLASVLERADLPSVRDPANADPALERAFLRQAVLPVLRSRRTGVDRTLARASGLCRDAALALDWFAGRFLDSLRGDDGSLALPPLLALPPEVQPVLLRRWIREQGVPLPGERRLAEVLSQCQARRDAQLAVSWAGRVIHRHRDRLYLLDEQARPDPAIRLPWRSARLDLPGHCGTLRWIPRPGRDPGAGWPQLEVRFRRGGERLRPARAGARRPLKLLLQELDVPPWRRARLPLLYADDELLAVADLVGSDAWEALTARHGVELRFERPPGG